ncbi:Vacuolar protein sorting-associated protein 55 [Blastocladiella emersonii ATCC 22665]|nr:Vacuolar protein sorting-associated protein 55 [Blastocladiella emersonii ATCC 22665]
MKGSVLRDAVALTAPDRVAVIALATALATGFLLVVLACALYSNWLPLLIVFTYILAPLPNMICTRCTGADDVFSDQSSSGWRDAGFFLTSFLVVSGFGLPLALTRSGIIDPTAGIMSVTGGVLVYGTIVAYGHYFSRSDDALF